MDNVIIAHKQIEQTLRHLTVVAEQAAEGIAILDLDGNVRFVNPAWVMLHGYDTAHELVGSHISIFHAEEHIETEVIPFIEETKRRGRLTGPIEHLRKDETLFPTETKMSVVTDEANKAIGLIVFATDVTQHKRAEDQVKRYRYQLEQRTAELTAANEKLQHESTERKQAEDELEQHCNTLEQRVEELTAELTTANEKLQHELTIHKQAEDRLKQYRDQLEQRVGELTVELTAVNENLRHEFTEHNLSEETRQTHGGLDGITEAEESKGGTPPFNPQELKSLGELAKRLV